MPVFRSLALIVSYISLVGCASVPLSAVKQAALADNLSTVVALEQGLPELNPLGFPATVVIKISVIEWAKTQPDQDRQLVERIATALWSGAAANNFAAAIGGGGFISPALGVFTALWLWADSREP